MSSQKIKFLTSPMKMALILNKLKKELLLVVDSLYALEDFLKN